MNYFLNDEEEISLVKFIAKYQYLSVNDTKYFFNSKKYYRKRITKLVARDYLRRVNLNLVLGKFGIQYVKLLNFEYTRLNRNKKYLQRLKYISNIAAFYNNCDTITFTPSFSMKDKDILTTTARRFMRNIKYWWN